MFRISFLALFPLAVFGAGPALRLPNVSVGQNLERSATVTLEEPPVDDDIDVAIRSSDPGRLLISRRPDEPGGASITVKVRTGHNESPEFWLQAREGSGEAQYIAETPHYTAASATVTMTPSAIAIVGPFKSSRLTITTGAPPARLTVVSARIDPSSGHLEEQPVWGPGPASVEVLSSRPETGRVSVTKLTLPPGGSYVPVTFQQAAEGETVLSLKTPAGFSAPPEHANVRVIVQKPRIAISDELRIGENLQVRGVLMLGELTPATGLDVTITSEDPKRLLVSASDKIVGSASIQLHLNPFVPNATYYLQALDHSGTVSYTASAKGYKSANAAVTLTPSGVVLTPANEGPPDEAQVLRKEAPDGTHRFLMSLKRPEKLYLVAWTAQLDPITHRSADITVQPLRAGVSLDVDLEISNPAVGELPSHLTISAASDNFAAEFKPRSPGSTEITVLTPKNFTPSANSTKVIGTVIN